MDYYNEDYLMHYGVKGMKWGVRRAKRKEAKQQYKAAVREARAKRSSAMSKADTDYEQAMSKQNVALKKVEDDHAKKQKTIDAQYNTEIDSHKSKANSAKSDMDFWGEGHAFYKLAEDKYNKHTKDAEDAQSRYDAATLANKIARDQAAIKVRDLYYDRSEKAAETRDAAYVDAGADFINAKLAAKQTYKEAKKQIKLGNV